MKFSKAFTLLATLSYSASAVEILSEHDQKKLEVNLLRHDVDADQFVPFLMSKSEQSHVKPLIPVLLEMRDLFVQWVQEFGREYESLEEELKRMKIWVENHGACLLLFLYFVYIMPRIYLLTNSIIPYIFIIYKK